MDNESANPSLNSSGGRATSPDGKTLDYIKQYIDASAESAARARFILLVMVTASVLALIAMWNSRNNSWTMLRLNVAADAQKFYSDDGQTLIRDEQLLEQNVWPKFITKEEYDSKSTQKEKDEYIKGRRQAFDSAKIFAGQPRFAK